MCGIIGIASCNRIYNEDWIDIGRKQLYHRGPDASGNWKSTNRKVFFQHQRLAVIDIIKQSNQPMVLSDGNYAIIFNGEIYNYKELKVKLKRIGKVFITESDTEVLLQSYIHWGTKCVNHFNGMFSFAIYDRNKNIVFLSRDRAGEKPLFYYYDNKNIYFASELKALLKNPRIKKTVNPQALDCYLTFGYVPNDLCIIEGFKKLPSAHSMLFSTDTGSIKISKYWNLPEFDEKNLSSEILILDELETLLEKSVKKQLISDVPIGVLLSGGIDSSLITSFASRAVKKLKTFTISFPGHKEFNETEHAKLIAKHFQTDHTELEAKETSVDLLPKLAKQFDEPMSDSSMIPTYLVSQLVREHCTVALGGDGGDELFGGYDHYSRLLWIQKYLGSMPFFIKNILSNLSSNYLPIGFKGRNWLSALNIDMETNLPMIASQFDLKIRLKLLSSYNKFTNVAENIFANNLPSNTNLLERATRMDFQNYLQEDILVKVDRASMLNSLEMRSPMLDQEVIEFAFSKVPMSLKANAHNKKILLKQLAKKVLPSDFDLNRKQGFSIPLNKWLLKGPFRDFFYDVLTSQSSVFELGVVQDLLKSIQLGHSNGERLFTLIMFQLWMEEYDVSL